MTTTNIELAKVRDFSAIINDTFLFLKQNFKPLMRAFFTFCGFFVLATMAVSAVQQLKMHDVMGITQARDYEDQPRIIRQLAQFGISTLLTLLFTLLTYAAISVTVLSYMVIYKEKGNVPPTNEEIWGYFKYYYLKICLYVFINGIIMFTGFLFCLVPGIWLYPIMSLTLPIVVMENSTYGYAFNQAFRLIKENWWVTFGALFIMWIIVVTSAAIVSLPGSLWNQLTLVMHWTGGDIAAILTAVLQCLSLVFYILPVITLALCYFNLNEAKEGSGLLARINQLGEEKSDNNLPAEEY